MKESSEEVELAKDAEHGKHKHHHKKKKDKRDKAKSSPHSNRPKESKFAQQKLKAWQPIMTPKPVIATYLIIGMVFIPLGYFMLAASQSVIEYDIRYDNRPECTGLNGTSCTVTFNIEKTMKAPVFFYYRLTNYFQNHRRYVKSRSDAQLHGDNVTTIQRIEDCVPIQTTEEGATDPAFFYLPCGLVAHSIFNDSFIFPALNMSENDIAWKSDLEQKFKEPPTDNPAYHKEPNFLKFPGDEWLSFKNEHFIVWMRVAGLPDFKKLYGRFEEDIPPGSYSVEIENNYPVGDFDGSKHVVLSTVSWLGGKNHLLGVAYLVVGSACMLMGIIFLILHRVRPRKLGDPKFLTWNANMAN